MASNLAKLKCYNESMKQLFTIDLKDYNPNGKKFYRPSVRGIIFDQNGNVAMIYSLKWHFYKFPGGGMEGNETQLETLIREVREETGLRVIPETVKEFGEVLKIQNEDHSENTIHIQQNFYYTCEVEDDRGEQELDEYEKEMDFVFGYVPIEEAIAKNAAFHSDNLFDNLIAEREKRVLEILKNKN